VTSLERKVSSTNPQNPLRLLVNGCAAHTFVGKATLTTGCEDHDLRKVA
jgi:hypothetical protein